MSKSTITKVFGLSVAAVLASVLLFVVGVAVIVGTGSFVTTGGEITSFHLSSVTPLMVALILVGLAALAVGCFGLLVAWIGALVNTARLPDPAWFLMLLALGLLSFGWVAVLVYLLAGPEPTERPTGRDGGLPSPAH